MVSSAPWMMVQVLVLTNEPGSGQVLLGEGEECGGSIAGRCEADLTCMAAEDKEQSSPGFGVCTSSDSVVRILFLLVPLPLLDTDTLWWRRSAPATFSSALQNPHPAQRTPGLNLLPRVTATAMSV
ncbi:hypothetical protein SRHO_G00326070 [Serrasalmus rhombeus]